MPDQKEQTALMQLIKYAQECADFITDDDSKEDKYARLAYKDIVQKVTSLLPVEKEQMVDAYDKGSDVDEDLKPLHGTAYQYYDNKFTK